MERSGNEYEAPREEREMEFAARKDTQEDRVNDGKRYSGLLTKEDYDARKRGFAERIRAERDPEAYAKEKLDAAVAREVAIERAAADARRERERIRREKLRAELEGGAVAKKKKKKKDKTKNAMLSFEEVDA